MPIIEICECDVCKSRADLRILDNGQQAVPEDWYITRPLTPAASSEIVVCSLKCIREINNDRMVKGLKPLTIRRTKQQIRDSKLKKLLEERE